MSAAAPVPARPHLEDSTSAPPPLAVVPAYRAPVCRCIPSVLTVADHHRCPLFRPA